MKQLKNEPENLKEILNESIWYNENLKIKKEYIYLSNWEKAGINTMRDLITDYGCFLNVTEIKNKYNITTNFLQLMQIHTSIPRKWKQLIKNANLPLPNSQKEIYIKLNNISKPLQLLKCKDFYWFLIKQNKHTPKSVEKWHKVYEELNNTIDNKWTDIYKLHFQQVNDTKIQSFQYRINHRILACNNWLKQIKIKDSNLCQYCNDIDTIQHFLIQCHTTKQFWKSFRNWWIRLPENNINLPSDISEKDEINILFGFPGGTDDISVLNYCIGYAKYFIYLQKLNTTKNIDFFTFLPFLKNKLQIKKYIHQKNNTEHRFKRLDKNI
jgi:hypothetical protein